MKLKSAVKSKATLNLSTMFPRKLKIQLDSSATKQTPFCKVCYDARRSGFDTHFVRDRPGGEVVCPYLLSLECAYCGISGHTVKYCDVLKTKTKPAPIQAQADVPVLYVKKAVGGLLQDKDGWNHRPSQAGKFVIVGLEQATEKKSSAAAPASKNKFSFFSEEIERQDNLEIQEAKFTSEFPSLGGIAAALPIPSSELSSWANVVKKTSPVAAAAAVPEPEPKKSSVIMGWRK